MKAKKKKIAKKSAGDYGVDLAPRVAIVNVTDPPKRSAGEKVEDVPTLVAKLKEKGVV